MTVGELFVSIGIKGAAKVGDTLSSIGKQMGDVSAQGLAAKAAVAGLVYGLESLMSNSAAMGMSLKQFATLTGFSAEELQKWQYAARQSGVEAEEVTSSIKGIQSAMAKMQLGQGPPGGIGIIAQYTGGFDEKKINDTYYMMDKLKQFAKSTTVPRPFANEFLKQAGLTDNMIQFLRSTEVDLQKIKPSQIFSDKEINTLAKINIGWANLKRTLDMQTGHFTAKYGQDIVNGLSNALKVVVDLTENIIKLMKAFPELKVSAGLALAGLALYFAPITSAIALVIAGLNQIQKFREKKDILGGTFAFNKDTKQYELNKKSSIGKGLSQVSSDWDKSSLKQNLVELFSPKTKTQDSSFLSNLENFFSPKGVTPNASQQAVPPSDANASTTGNSSNVNINQNITHYGDAKDTKAVKDVHKAAAAAFYRTNASQLRAT